MTGTITASQAEIWMIICLLGAGTFVLRFSFLGFIGNRPMPPMMARMLRYTAVAVLPAMVAPLVLWPAATAGVPDPARLLAALATLAVGIALPRPLVAIAVGMCTLYAMQALMA